MLLSMKKNGNTFLAIVLITAFSVCVRAQNVDYSGWTQEELKKANTAQACTSLSNDEKEVVLLTNLVRIDGVKFRETVAKPYLDGKTTPYIISLYSQLEDVKDLPLLYPDARLCDAAKYHATEMGNAGARGHVSLDGTTFSARLKKFGYPSNTYMAENCSYGFSDAVGIVMQLLVDEGVPSLGHRLNIFSPHYKAIGVSISTHRMYKYTCVQDFGNRVVAPMTSPTDGHQVVGAEKTMTTQNAINKGLAAWTEAELQKANTAKNCRTLSQEERELILLLNLARLNGTKFADSFVKPYFMEETGDAIESLCADLTKMADYPMLAPDALLCRVAKNHANDIGNRGVVSHKSADGTDSYQRMKNMGYQAGSYSETLDVGNSDAIDILMKLLLDSSYSQHPNRQILLSKSNKAIGVAISPHSKYEHCTVLDFGSSINQALDGAAIAE